MAGKDDAELDRSVKDLSAAIVDNEKQLKETANAEARLKLEERNELLSVRWDAAAKKLEEHLVERQRAFEKEMKYHGLTHDKGPSNVHNWELPFTHLS